MTRMFIVMGALLAFAGSAVADTYIDFLACDFAWSNGKDKAKGSGHSCTVYFSLATVPTKEDVIQMRMECADSVLYRGTASLLVKLNPVETPAQGVSSTRYPNPPKVDFEGGFLSAGDAHLTWGGHFVPGVCR